MLPAKHICCFANQDKLYPVYHQYKEMSNRYHLVLLSMTYLIHSFRSIFYLMQSPLRRPHSDIGIILIAEHLLSKCFAFSHKITLLDSYREVRLDDFYLNSNNTQRLSESPPEISAKTGEIMVENYNKLYWVVFQLLS